MHRREIDDRKWDRAVERSTAETLYPYSWYMDAVADSWSALVTGDYRVVMPLAWKKKYGLTYLYQPFYTQQLGVFSENYVDPLLISEMLSMLLKKFRFASINFNTKNLVGEVKPFRVYDKSNYVLDLRDEYDQLKGAFSTNARRNVKRALEISPGVVRDVSCGEMVSLKKENDVIRRSDADYQWLLKLMETIMDRGAGQIYGAREEGNLSAAAFFGFSRSRAIYLVSASGERGKEQRSMFGIVDAFIREHAGSELILDFEGSNIPSVARFFAGFGARPEIYQNVTFSRLPLFLKKFRRDE